MFRLFITYILPLVAPFLMYLAWNAYVRYKAKKAGEEAPSLEKGPIFWSLVAGFFLLIISLTTLALMGSHKADRGKYVPPRFEDGRIIPPNFDGK